MGSGVNKRNAKLKKVTVLVTILLPPDDAVDYCDLSEIAEKAKTDWMVSTQHHESTYLNRKEAISACEDIGGEPGFFGI